VEEEQSLFCFDFWLELKATRVGTLLLAVGLTWLLEACAPAGPSVVLVTLDTVRADAYGCYGNRLAHTPNLDRLARTGVLFERCISPVPNTLPAHATILTGLYPYQHGVRDNTRYLLPAQELTIAELLSGHGFETAAFVSAQVLERRFGLDQGFDLYDDELFTAGLAWTLERSADETAQRAAAWLRRYKRSRVFLWVHFFDPHQPYQPPPEWALRFPDNPYAGEIAAADAALARIIDAVDLSRCLLIVAGDHGEGLGEHGEDTHGYFAYSSTLHVPLVIHFPDGSGEGQRVAQEVSLVDIMPTVLDQVGISLSDPVDGINLGSLVAGGNTGERLLYIENTHPLVFEWAPLAGWHSRQWHYLEAPQPELYELANDPQELRNVIAEYPEVAAQLGQALAELEPFANLDDPEVQIDLTVGEREMLQVLGYASGEAEPEADFRSLPDPKDKIACFTGFININAHSHSSPEEGLEMLTELHRLCPGMFKARLLEGVLLRQAGSFAESITVLESCRQERPQDRSVWYNLALTLNLARDRRAIELCRDGLARFPDEPGLWDQQGLAQRIAGLEEEAVASGWRAVELSSGKPEYLTNLGTTYLTGGHYEQAVEILRRAAAGQPTASEARLNLGQALLGLGEVEAAEQCLRQLIEHDPDHNHAWLLVAKILLIRQRADEALPIVQRLRREQPYDPDLLYLAGEAHRQRGELELAEQALRAFLNRRPDYPPAYEILVEILLAQQPPRYEAARALVAGARSRGVPVVINDRLRPD
jgi:arylsulfatase A-like enzyme/Flp pilus assembly protein TadD